MLSYTQNEVNDMGNNLRSVLKEPAGSYENWTSGYLAGNGRVGIIELCNPYENHTVYCHRRFYLARDTKRSFDTVDKDNIEAIRNACASGDWKKANDLANTTTGWKDGGEGQKHPGFSLKTDITPDNYTEYVRTCDYSTGEITVKWRDSRGEWVRKSFVSRTDGVVVTKIIAPKGCLTCQLKMELKEEMHFPEEMQACPYADGMSFGITVKYSQSSKGTGYEGYARVSADGGNIKAEGDILSVENADSITVYSYCDRYDENCETCFGSVLKSRIDEVSDNYEVLFARHAKAHREIFERVSLSLKGEMSELTNTELISAQKKTERLLPDMYERLFYAGRYHFISCCDSKGAPDLLGLWTGDCNVGWDGFFHLDANFNLQCSGGIIGNMSDMMEGYFYLFDCWAEDFRTIAKKLLGCRGMIGGGNTPGESSGLISGLSDYFYPYHYVTGEISWLLYPFYEYYTATEDTDFLRNRLYPYLLEMADFYEDFLKLKDSNGKYLFAGSISPENRPKGVPYSLVNNSLFDIEGARFVFRSLITCGIAIGEDEDRIKYWKKQLELLPNYKIEEDGSLGEWAYEGLNNDHYHRHCSGLMGVWPYRFITPEADKTVFDAAAKTLECKDGFVYQGAGHGLLHAALIAAGVNNTTSLSAKLLEFVQTDFFFDTLASAHYRDQRVFCTDVCHTLPTVLIQSIVASDEHGIELLPACPFSKGEIRGILTKCGCEIERLEWNERSVAVELRSKSDKMISIYNRKAGKSVNVELTAEVSACIVL